MGWIVSCLLLYFYFSYAESRKRGFCYLGHCGGHKCYIKATSSMQIDRESKEFCKRKASQLQAYNYGQDECQRDMMYTTGICSGVAIIVYNNNGSYDAAGGASARFPYMITEAGYFKQLIRFKQLTSFDDSFQCEDYEKEDDIYGYIARHCICKGDNCNTPDKIKKMISDLIYELGLDQSKLDKMIGSRAEIVKKDEEDQVKEAAKMEQRQKEQMKGKEKDIAKGLAEKLGGKRGGMLGIGAGKLGFGAGKVGSGEGGKGAGGKGGKGKGKFGIGAGQNISADGKGAGVGAGKAGGWGYQWGKGDAEDDAEGDGWDSRWSKLKDADGTDRLAKTIYEYKYMRRSSSTLASSLKLLILMLAIILS